MLRHVSSTSWIFPFFFQYLSHILFLAIGFMRRGTSATSNVSMWEPLLPGINSIEAASFPSFLSPQQGRRNDGSDKKKSWRESCTCLLHPFYFSLSLPPYPPFPPSNLLYSWDISTPFVGKSPS